MKKVIIRRTGNIIREDSTYEGIPLEYVLVKVTQEKTPIESVSPEIFTERKHGVLPETDIRHDKWDTAHETMNIVANALIMQRDAKENTEGNKKDGGDSPKINLEKGQSLNSENAV